MWATVIILEKILLFIYLIIHFLAVLGVLEFVTFNEIELGIGIELKIR